MELAASAIEARVLVDAMGRIPRPDEVCELRELRAVIVSTLRLYTPRRGGRLLLLRFGLLGDDGPMTMAEAAQREGVSAGQADRMIVRALSWLRRPHGRLRAAAGYPEAWNFKREPRPQEQIARVVPTWPTLTRDQARAMAQRMRHVRDQARHVVLQRHACTLADEECEALLEYLEPLPDGARLDDAAQARVRDFQSFTGSLRRDRQQLSTGILRLKIPVDSTALAGGQREE